MSNTEEVWERTMMAAIGEDGPQSVADAIKAMKAENKALKKAVVEGLYDAATLADIGLDGKGLHLKVQGGAAALLANSFADQFTEQGGKNYIELNFHHPDVGHLIVTLQKGDGKTPGQLKSEADAEIERLTAELERAKAAPVAVPDGWSIDKVYSHPDDCGIMVLMPDGSGVFLSNDTDSHDHIAHTVLYELADAMLNAAPQAPADSVDPLRRVLEQINPRIEALEADGDFDSEKWVALNCCKGWIEIELESLVSEPAPAVDEQPFVSENDAPAHVWEYQHRQHWAMGYNDCLRAQQQGGLDDG